jgi:hypothetical protein
VRVSTVDPSAVKPYRLIAAAVMYALAVVNAGVSGWSWLYGARTDVDPDAQVGVFVTCTMLMAPLILGTAFLVPIKYRTGKQATAPVVIGLGGLALAMALGMLIGAGRPTATAGIVLAVGVILIVGAVLSRRRARQQADTYTEITRTGTKTTGLVTESAQTSTVNGCPRWRVVVKFTDGQSTDRWVVKHVTTWSPPSKKENVTVHYDPTRPSDRKRIFVDEIDSRG